MAQTSFSHILRIMVVKDSIEWLGNLRSINNHNDHSLESHLPRCLINPDQGQILRQELKCKFFFQHSQFWNTVHFKHLGFCILCLVKMSSECIFCEFFVWVWLPDIWWIMGDHVKHPVTREQQGLSSREPGRGRRLRRNFTSLIRDPADQI